MNRTVYISAVVGIVIAFLSLGLGVAWGLVLEKDGPLILASSFSAVGAGLIVGAVGFTLGLVIFRRRSARVGAASDGRDEVGEYLPAPQDERESLPVR